VLSEVIIDVFLPLDRPDTKEDALEEFVKELLALVLADRKGVIDGGHLKEFDLGSRDDNRRRRDLNAVGGLGTFYNAGHDEWVRGQPIGFVGSYICWEGRGEKTSLSN
jgi:hypothetical protein